VEVELPEIFDQALGLLQKLMAADMAQHLGPYEERGRERLSSVMRDTLAEGREVSAVDYNAARDGREILNAGLDAVFERFDAIITPAARGEAPRGLESTGDPVFSTLWTYCGTPALSLPLLAGSSGLPIGVQLVGRKFDDGRLLRTANWLTRELGS
jgi:Asp-tRNA(Asn)/Glu-tRNA(Gln) amidotransferase A subunit family amidase